MFPGSSDSGQRTADSGLPLPFRLLLLSAVCCLLSVTACRQKMANQPRYDPLEPSDFFADGMSARPRIPGTVARGELAIDPVVASGKSNGQDIDGFPMAVTPQV